MYRTSIQMNEAAGGATAGGPPPAPPVAPAAPAAPASGGTGGGGPPAGDPDWFKPRIDQAKRSGETATLTAIGAPDAASAKAAWDEHQARLASEKSATTRAKELEGAVAAEKARADRAHAFAAERAGRQLMALTPAQQAAVRLLAPDTDPIAQLQALDVLSATWSAAEAATRAAVGAAPGSTAPPPGTPPPASTGPGAGTAPPGAVPGSPPNHRLVYETTRTTNPFLAAQYAGRNPEAYTAKT